MNDVVGNSLFLTVPEVARRLGISRAAAYQLARRWLEGDHASGFPALRLGRSLRVPASAFERGRANGFTR